MTSSDWDFFFGSAFASEDEKTKALFMTAAVVLAVTIGLLWGWISNRAPRVVKLQVYPIKSCAPMTLKSAQVTELGFLHDRFAQLSDAKGQYLTPRDRKCVKLFHVKPRIVSNTGTLTTTLEVGAPGMDSELVVDLAQTKKISKVVQAIPMTGPKVKLQDYGDEVAAWFAKATGIAGCRLTAMGPGYKRLVEVNPDQGDELPKSTSDAAAPTLSLADEAPFLLTSMSSLYSLNQRLKARSKKTVDMERFRPNICVSGFRPWEEDTWKRIRIQDVEFHVWQRCGRCAMTTIDRTSLERGPEPLATLSEFRERAKGMRNFGMHLIPVADTLTASSALTLGDKVEVLEYDAERLAEWERLFG